MPRFRYRALRQSGGEIEGELLAADERAAASHIQDQGSYPIEIAPSSASPRAAARARGIARLSSRELMLFTRQMAALLGAGVALDRALALDRSRPRGRTARAACGGAPRVGRARRKPVARARRAFRRCRIITRRSSPPARRAAISAPRSSGWPALVERNRAIGQSLANALIYPASVLVVACLSISFLLGFVVPRFSALIEGFRAAPPLAMRFLLAASRAVPGRQPAGARARAARRRLVHRAPPRSRVPRCRRSRRLLALPRWARSSPRSRPSALALAPRHHARGGRGLAGGALPPRARPRGTPRSPPGWRDAGARSSAASA